jgi:hypothetical protein
MDAPTVRILEQMLEREARMVEQSRELRTALPALDRADRAWVAGLARQESAIEKLVAPAGAEPLGASDPALFAPGPARDARFDVKERWVDCANFPAGHPKQTVEFLHRQMNEEVDSLESSARNLADFRRPTGRCACASRASATTRRATR